MSLAGLLNQTATIYIAGSYDEYGQAVNGTGVSVKCRFQRQSKRRLLPNGDVITILAIVYVPSGTVINTGDKITYGTDNYKVFGRYDAVGATGDTHHLKLELVKW